MSTMYGLPDPTTQFEFYDGVAPKRAIAWLIDMAVTGLISLPFMLPFLATAFLIVPLFAIPVIFAITGFLYRWFSIASGSATWGMRFMAIELRDRDGHRLDSNTAFLHTLGTTLSFAISPAQLVSVAAMLLSERGQGLTDMVLGTAMLNRAA